jgi:hypothetical protein
LEDDAILADVFGSKDNILVCEAVVHIGFEDTWVRLECAVVKEEWNKSVGNPSLMMVGEGQERISYLHLIRDSGICDIPFHVEELLEFRVEGG